MPDTISNFHVLRLVRDARSTRNADRHLLVALAIRCDPKKKYLAWPSYRQLALDTMLDEVTLKRAAKRLQDADLIKRVIRQNRSNRFYINVALLQEQAAANTAAEKERKEKLAEESPFEQPVLTTADMNDMDELDEGGVA